MKSGVAGFDWDDGNWPKCGKHGVAKTEIEQALQDGPLILADRNPQTEETRFNAVGKNEHGRYIFIVFTLRNKDDQIFIRPISARYMHRKEIEHYEQQKG